MIVLLDENFPLRLVRELRQFGFEVEHIIELGLRGIPDAIIVERLRTDPVLFLTQDADFLDVSVNLAAVLIVSRVPQQMSIVDRVTIWRTALERYVQDPPAGKLFELLETGQLVPVDFLPM